MDTRKQELKRLKKECKRAKRRYIALWKTLGIVFLVLALLVAQFGLILKVFDHTVATLWGGTFWELKNADENAIYYKSDFVTQEEMTAYKEELCRQVEAEGAVLLMNENGALPLETGAKVSFFGSEDMKTALAKTGFAVTEAGEPAAATGDAAIVVLTEETDLLQALSAAKQAGKIQKIIVLISNADALPVDFFKGNPYGVDGALWIGETGDTGAEAIAEILAGKANPSGSLTDTLVYENNTAPALQNLSDLVFAGYEAPYLPAFAGAYQIQNAGIYVGYKYYETRYEDFVMTTGNPGNYVYGNDVVFPFGFGLSYTTFAYSDLAVEYVEKTDKFQLTVTVTNTGAVAGKETVQVYAQSPYTDYDKANGVEKASVNLVGFGKTQLIAPGASETVTVTVDKRDLASFDTYGAKTYIMDAGKYYLTVATDAHNAVNNILAAKGFTPESTNNRMDEPADATLTYGWEQVDFDAKTYATASNGTPITNQLSNADPNLYQGVQEQVKWVSRQDWVGTLTQKLPELQLTQTLTDHLQSGQYNPADYPTLQMPTLGAENGLALQDVIGLPFDDPKWQTILDQLTFGEMVTLIGDGFYWQMPVASVEAPGAQGAVLAENGLPSRNVLAATFNTELVSDVGKLLGDQCLAEGVSRLYDTNCDDYSEDSFLAGKMCVAQVSGVQSKGVNVTVGFFVHGDVMENQTGQSLWLNEQAAREGHLRTIQYAVEQNPLTGVITGNSKLGATAIAGHKGLMTHILRDEWGSRGVVIQGNGVTSGLEGQDGVLAGTTAFGAVLPMSVWEMYRYENDPVVVSAMRQACHYNLYTLANSAGMNGIGENTTIQIRQLGYVTACWITASVCLVLYIFFAILWHGCKKRWRKSRAYLNYMTMKNTLKEENKNR